MGMDCDVICDLLPLYVEGMASPGSCRLIEEHLSACETCRKTFAQIKEPAPPIVLSANPAKKFQRAFRKHTATVAAVSAFVTIAAGILIWGLFFLRPGDEMGYALLNFYLLLPLTALVCSWTAGMRSGWVKWLAPLLFGGIGWFLPLAVFHSTDPIFLFFAFLPSIVGVLAGAGLSTIRARRHGKTCSARHRAE